jgi:hypothetical protein
MDNMDNFPTVYPTDKKGPFVITQRLNETNYMLYEVDHGKPNSDTLRNIETGIETHKDINEIDAKYDYIAIDRTNNLILSSTGVGVKEFEKVLKVALGNTDIKIEPFYSKEKIIETMQYLSEIIFYTKPESSLLGIPDELSDAIRNTKMIDSANDKIKEISLSIKFDRLPLSDENKKKIESYLSDSTYKNVSVKTSDDNFTNFINSSSVSTTIKLKNQTIENGKLKVSDFKIEFEKLNIYELVGETHV